MSALAAVQAVALLSTGLKAGVLFGDRIGVRFARPELSPSSFVKFQQVQLLHWEKFMPAIGFIAVLSSGAWLALIWSRIGSISFILVALATLAHTSSLVLAGTGCLPINKQLMAWSVSSPPPDVTKIWARWEQVNAIRTLLAVSAFVCVVLAFVA
jgi:hypothetical protein